MHVGIADQRCERQATDEFICAGGAGFRPQDGRDIGVTAGIVFIVRELAKDLGEIFHVIRRPRGARSKRSTASARPGRRAASGGSPWISEMGDETRGWNLYACGTRQLQHHILVFGNASSFHLQ